jgi:hypothetical protein
MRGRSLQECHSGEDFYQNISPAMSSASWSLGERCYRDERNKPAGMPSFKGNYIASLRTDDDRIVLDHEAKAAIIWQDFKERIGSSDNPVMLFDLQNIFF